MGAKPLTIPISGLRCAGSECYTLERALRREPGVVDVYVNPVTEIAYIDYDPAMTGPGASNAQDRSHDCSAGRPRRCVRK